MIAPSHIGQRVGFFAAGGDTRGALLIIVEFSGVICVRGVYLSLSRLCSLLVTAEMTTARYAIRHSLRALLTPGAPAVQPGTPTNTSVERHHVCMEWMGPAIGQAKAEFEKGLQEVRRGLNSFEVMALEGANKE
jgi:hypothetical protein